MIFDNIASKNKFYDGYSLGESLHVVATGTGWKMSISGYGSPQQEDDDNNNINDDKKVS